MTKTARETTQPAAGPRQLWTALRTRIHAAAEQRQLRRELAPYGASMTGVAPGDTAVTREIRAMLLHDFERSA
jgi:hypothetical protein